MNRWGATWYEGCEEAGAQRATLPDPLSARELELGVEELEQVQNNTG